MSTGSNQGLHWVGFDEVKRSSGWFLAVGIALMLLGAVSLGASVLVTLVWMELIGGVLIAGGILATVHAFYRRRWGGFSFDLFAGILYLVVGFLLVAHPAEAAITLTLLIALSLFLSGIFRIVASLIVRFQHWPWVLLNGIVNVWLGLLIWKQWPWSGLWVIGLFVGIDLILYGWSLVMLGLTARQLPEQST